MTTIVWTPGCFAADSCFTEETGTEGSPLNRTYGQKLKWRGFYGKRATGSVIACASRGDSDAGEELDILLLKQCCRLINSGCLTLASELNDEKLLKARREAIKDTGTDAILVWMHPTGRDNVYRVNGLGRVTHMLDQFYATGHDAGVAYGALGAGANALRAVELAAKYGVCTSRPTHYLLTVEGKIEFKTLAA